jgi:hypothetical protein
VAGRKDIAKDGKATQFTSGKQPKKRGRRPNIFAKLKKQSHLSKADVQGLCSLILTSQSSDLSEVLKKYPSILTEALIAQLAQDRTGFVSRPTKSHKKVEKKADGCREEITTYEFDERIKRMDTVAWMVEQVIGKPTQPTELEITSLPDSIKNRLGDIASSEETSHHIPKPAKVIKETIKQDKSES